MADPLKERISLLEMGEAQGKLKPAHLAELAAYRAKGLAKTTAPAAPGQPAPANPTDLAAPATVPKGQAAQAAYTKVAASRMMAKQLQRVQSLYSQNFSKGGLSGLAEYNPLSSKNQQFDAALSTIPVLARQAFRVSGSGADSDRELKLITDTMPSRWSFDATNAERFKSAGSVLKGFVNSYGGLAGYSPAQVRAMQQEMDGAPAPRRSLPKAPPTAGQNNAAALRAKYGLK